MQRSVLPSGVSLLHRGVQDVHAEAHHRVQNVLPLGAGVGEEVLGGHQWGDQVLKDILQVRAKWQRRKRMEGIKLIVFRAMTLFWLTANLIWSAIIITNSIYMQTFIPIHSCT